jgi:striatin 1/3/4
MFNEPINQFNNININNNENLNIDNDDFTEKINESSSGQTHHTGETVLKRPNDFNSNINTSISNSLSNSMKKSNSNNNNTNSNNNTNEHISTNFNNLRNTPPPTISQSSSVIFQPYSKIEGFSSANSLSSKRSGGRNGPQSVLKFHLDSVRGIYIDPFQKVLTSVSEDKTIALWDLEKILKHQKDEEPFLVFRIHTTPIFTVTGASNKKIIGDYLNNVSVYSSGSDGVIRGIKIPNINTPNSEENLNKYTLLSWRVHQDMIWQLNYHPSNFLLSSVSSDGTVKIFKTYELYEEKIFEENKFLKTSKKINLHHYYHYDNSYSKNLVRNLVFRNRRDNIIEIPTSCDWRPEISSQIIVSHIAPYIKLYDIETGQNINDFSFDIERNIQYESKQVNKITFFNNDLFVTGHEDKHVKFFDVNSNKIINDFVAHTDSLNDLCKGFNDYQLLTCSQDGSVRSWDLRGGKNKLIFDIPAHRKKYDEGCFTIKTLQYRGENYFITCGADGCIKIFSP